MDERIAPATGSMSAVILTKIPAVCPASWQPYGEARATGQAYADLAFDFPPQLKPCPAALVI